MRRNRATSGSLTGYAQVSTINQDRTAERDALARLGVETERVYLDHGRPAPTGGGRASTRHRRLAHR